MTNFPQIKTTTWKDISKILPLMLLAIFFSEIFTEPETGQHMFSVSTAFASAAILAIGKRVFLPLGLSYFLFEITFSETFWSGHALSSLWILVGLSLVLEARNRWEHKRTQRLNHMQQAVITLLGCGLFLPLFVVSASYGCALLLGISVPHHILWFILSGEALGVITLMPLFFIGITHIFKLPSAIPLDQLVNLRPIKSTPVQLASIIAVVTIGIGVIFSYPPNDIGIQLVVIAIPLLSIMLSPYGYLISMATLGVFTAALIYRGLDLYQDGDVAQARLITYEVVFFSLSALFLMFNAKSLDQREGQKKALRQARRDPITLLDNISQLRLDLTDDKPVILAFLHLSQAKKLFEQLTIEGNLQLLLSLQRFVSQSLWIHARTYQMPFSRGLLLLLPDNDISRRQLQQFSGQLANFHFHWDQNCVEIHNASINALPLAGGASEQQLDNAISSLYQASKTHLSPTGKLSWVVSMSDGNTTNRLKQLSDLQAALRNDAFTLFAQTFHRLDGASAKDYFEVLIRWQRDDGTVIPPADFLPVIEEFNMQKMLDHWVIDHTLHQLSKHYKGRWQQLGHCSINLLPQTAGNPEIVTFIHERLGFYAVPASKLMFEITEHAALGNEIVTIEIIVALRKMGCQVALDDFGTGYASFDYLRRLPVSTVKIDGSFVKNMLENPVDESIVRSVHQTALKMGLDTVAEFVTSPEHLVLLQEIGVHFAQGYAISKPVPLEKCLATFCQRTAVALIG